MGVSCPQMTKGHFCCKLWLRGQKSQRGQRESNARWGKGQRKQVQIKRSPFWNGEVLINKWMAAEKARKKQWSKSRIFQFPQQPALTFCQQKEGNLRASFIQRQEAGINGQHNACSQHRGQISSLTRCDETRPNIFHYKHRNEMIWISTLVYNRKVLEYQTIKWLKLFPSAIFL